MICDNDTWYQQLWTHRHIDGIDRVPTENVWYMNVSTCVDVMNIYACIICHTEFFVRYYICSSVCTSHVHMDMYWLATEGYLARDPRQTACWPTSDVQSHSYFRVVGPQNFGQANGSLHLHTHKYIYIYIYIIIYIIYNI